MTLPTREEINEHDDLDARLDEKNFHGQDQAAVEKMFEEYPSRYGEDLMSMGPVAFRYYILAAIRYLRNESATGQVAFVTGFILALELRLQDEPEELVPIADELAAICGYIIKQYDRLGRLPTTDEERCLLLNFLRESFAKSDALLGEDSERWSPEDCIDMRPRCARLQQEFLRLHSGQSS